MEIRLTKTFCNMTFAPNKIPNFVCNQLYVIDINTGETCKNWEYSKVKITMVPWKSMLPKKLVIFLVHISKYIVISDNIKHFFNNQKSFDKLMLRLLYMNVLYTSDIDRLKSKMVELISTSMKDVNIALLLSLFLQWITISIKKQPPEVL